MNEVYKKYGDILHLSRPISENHTPMSMLDRAAQFAPFAALTGHEEAIEETARLTDEMICLDENGLKHLNEQLVILQDHIKEKPEIEVRYFVPDEKKTGGAYEKKIGQLRRLDEVEKVLYFMDGTEIAISMISEIKGDVFCVTTEVKSAP